MDRADHPRDGRAVGGAGDECIEVVLGLEGGADGPITLEDGDAADRPVGDAARQNAVDVHRLVGTVEGADAEMDDAGRKGSPVVAGRGHRGSEAAEGGGVSSRGVSGPAPARSGGRY